MRGRWARDRLYAENAGVHKTVFWAEIGFMRKGRWKKVPWLKGLAKENDCRMGLRGIGI